MVLPAYSLARDYTKLQEKELKHAQKYGSTNRYFDNYQINQSFNTKKSYLKDPKIIKLGAYYTVISDDDYNSKLKADQKEYDVYERQFKKVNWTNYNSQAQGRDYYRVYRVAERIIRANRLDYQPWRIAIVRATADFNAFSTAANCIILYTSVIDSFINNDDALAMVLSHEFAHSLLGHSQRSLPDSVRMQRMYRLAKMGNAPASVAYAVYGRKKLIDSKNMEYAADIEGAKLACKAGYDLSKCIDCLSFMETLAHMTKDTYSDHPTTKKRIASFNQNRRYFPEDIWSDMGKYNICKTDVLEVTASSDRASIVISPSQGNIQPSTFYHPETMDELYTRMGYTSYLNGEFEKSLEYFDKLFDRGCQSASAYLYASYAAQELYKKSKDNKYKTKAVNYINQAKSFDNDNKYINEQINSL